MKTKQKFIFTGLLVMMLIVGITGGASAVHDDGLFQLDYVTSPTAQGAANVSSSNISPSGNTGDDWDNVYAGTSGAFATAFIIDPTGSAETSFYTGGGSKDERPISTSNQHWEWNDTNDVIPDKDDLSHAFAAAYVDPDSQHIIFYFGADRFDTSGDAEVGFWFFRQVVTLGTKPNFNGEHEVGDMLVLANWGGSNKVGDIAVYQWVGGTNPLLLIRDTTQADCSVAPANDGVCAVVNNAGGETPPWSYTNKDGQHSYQSKALFEGGIDLNDLLGVQDIGCFSSFLAATRSSHSTTAQLKDFALGAFPVCGVSVDKTGDTLSKVGDPVNYTITITNTGHATLYKRNISDTLLGGITTNGVDQANSYVTSNNCGASLAPGASCTITLTRTVQAGDPDPLPNTVNILYSEKANFTGLEFTDSDDHEVNLFQPAVMITKAGDGLSKIGDSVTYTFTISNSSSQDSPNLTLASISDSVLGDLSSQANAAGCGTLAYNGGCTFTVNRTIQSGDPDPVDNTVNVLYHPVGFPNDIKASDSHSVNLFQPSVSITKDGNELSKIGDKVTYHVAINNTSSSDSPNLVLDSISDDVLGDLSSYASSCSSLSPGASCNFDVQWTVAAVDVNPADGQADDPVINTVTIHFHPDGFPNDIIATASHKLNLFQPSIAFGKTADTELSKATDVVNYTLTLNNGSSPDTPDLVCTITDAKLGVNKQVTLKSGEGDVTNIAYTVQASDPDPLVNNASVSCSPTGFPNVLTGSGSWTVNLFRPSVTIEKTGDTQSKIDDDVTYHFKITNTSSADSPDLKLDSISDDVLGDLKATASANGCDNLASGASCEFDVQRTVQATDPDPLVNTVNVLYHPLGFPNDITASDSHSVDLFQPTITFNKTVDVTLSKAGDSANYTLTLNNTSSPDTPALNCTITDTLLGINEMNIPLASGGSKVINMHYTFKASDPDPFTNTATASCQVSGFSNVLTKTGSATVNLFQPKISLTKTGDALSKIGDKVNYTITLNNESSSDTPDLSCTISDPTVSANWSGTLASGASKVVEVKDFVIPDNVSDPFENTASATCSPVGFPNVLTASDSHSVNLFQPSVTIEKTGDTLSKVGDDVNYTITVNNTSSSDTPNLSCTLTDAKLSINKSFSLASGGSNVTNATYTVKNSDADPLLNTASVSCSPEGFPNVLTASDGHSVNLFQPSVAIDKTGDTLSKVGDDVAYAISVNNTSSADTPNLSCTLTDVKLGINKSFSLASGANNVTNATYTVKPSDSDPLLNTASVSCSPAGFPNVLTANDGHSVNLFQPSVNIAKTGPAFSKAGDTATYGFTINNTSSSDSPALILDSASDSVVGSLTAAANAAGCSSLAPSASCSFSASYTVKASDPDPLVNVVTVHFHPDGFPNDISNTASHSTDLLHPSFTVSKVCKANTEPIPQAGPAVFTITFNNTGDADLHVVPSEGAPFDVAAGQSYPYDYSINGPFNATVGNTVTGLVTLAPNYNLPNQYTFSASGSCIVEGKAKVVKTVNGQPLAADQTFTFQLRQGASTVSDGTILEQQNTDANGNINFATSLVPGQTYQICEWVFPGWNTNLAGDGPLFVPNSIIPPALPNPNVNNLTVCANFTVTSGQTRTFTVDNTPPPGGRALTIGFWKNWASCASSNGRGQKYMLDLALGIATAATPNPPDGLVVSAQNANGGWPTYAPTYYLVLKGNPASTQDNILPAPNCLEAIRLLDKSRIDNGKKMASDPLFNMTAQLIAAQLNRFMGAGISGVTITNIDRAVLLNGKYKFNGITHDKLSAADTALANCLATQLDNYNNNRPVSACP